ncbi:molybdenum cofactor biosynthesis protein MoaE [Lacisediminihabitans changchengi]|uniref:Molybdenum cofactor biosynthesis protein MoaE n=1 Tax=Lacisediminihabitans changchengi TaxID=2787634 RepID=A0A934SJD3_9MICO|nr:molybdenum cofactor biosynthesis protein MoaE [Lacisediminihabitans changchengi]MBK4346361.1 molybdenum cofactor biosynthesis protein MoaE [Lacisediminihabitans changchengi]
MSEFALVSDTPLDAAAIEQTVLSDEHGALVTFRGIVRNHDHGLAVSALEYQAHPEAARFLAECCATITAETGLPVAAAHRTGHLVVGDIALVAAVAAGHRGEAFAACEKLVDLIKQTVPIWKRQHLADGATEWVGL